MEPGWTPLNNQISGQAGAVFIEWEGSITPPPPPPPPPPGYYGYYDYYYYGNCGCEPCCLVRIKVGEVGVGYFDVEYCVDEKFPGDLIMDFNWAACGPVTPCKALPPPPVYPIIGEVSLLQKCEFQFTSKVTCGGTSAAPTYHWDLGDGVHTSSEPTFTFRYDQPGTYKATLIATCADGRIFTDSITVIAC
jgi:hypothetical protein